MGFQNVVVGRINRVVALTGFLMRKRMGFSLGPKKSGRGRNNEVVVRQGSTVFPDSHLRSSLGHTSDIMTSTLCLCQYSEHRHKVLCSCCYCCYYDITVYTVCQDFHTANTYLPTLTPWARVSRLQVENFDLTLAHACEPISHAWLKKVSCCPLARHNFQKYFTQTHVRNKNHA